MLYRAICCSTASACQDGAVIAYVEASRRDLAAYKLALILATMWAVPADTIHIRSIETEVQLRSHTSATHRLPADVDLLRLVGSSERAAYATAPLLLVGDTWRARLSEALRHVHILAAAQRSPGVRQAHSPYWKGRIERIHGLDRRAVAGAR